MKDYKNILKRVVDIINAAENSDIGFVNICTYIGESCPELKESEDEESKKWILEYLYDGLRKSDEQFKDQFKSAIEWLEKQGNNPQGKAALEAIHEDKVDNANKLTPKKFGIGDVIANDCCFGKVIETTNDAYLLDTGQGIPFSCEHNAHLWTIADAKDGDILVSKTNQPFIYNGNYNAVNVGAYCGILCDGSMFIETIDACQWTSINNIKPATKEQCNALFQKMKAAGYKWFADKKELRMVEP